MDANSLIRFAQACGAVRPLDWQIERPNGSIGLRTSVPQPFAVVGSDPYCDVALPGSGLAAKHLAVQVVEGRVFAVDISGAGHGMMVNGIPRSDTWMNEGDVVVLNGHRLTLTGPVAPPAGDVPRNFHPLAPNPGMVGRCPKTQIEFRNGRTAQSRWDVNRVMTFIGRAKACKINLTSDDISLFHCYLLLTIDGLWAVDVFGRGGISVNGLPQRFFRMSVADELAIARFQIGVAYPHGDPGEPIVPLASVTPGPRFEEFADRPILKTDEQATPLPTAPDTPSPQVEMPKDLVIPTTNGQTSDANVAVTGAMFEQFQNSMLMMMKMFGQMHQQQMAGLQQEMARLASITDEIGRMQSDIQKAVVPESAKPHVNHLPAPDDVPTVTEASAEQHQNIFDKMAKLEAERQSIWKRLANVFGPKTAMPS